MQLTYRGNQYELPTSTTPAVSGDVIGKYRGAIIRTQRYIVAPRSQPLDLAYRGAQYRPVVKHLESTGLVNAI